MGGRSAPWARRVGWALRHAVRSLWRIGPVLGVGAVLSTAWEMVTAAELLAEAGGEQLGLGCSLRPQGSVCE